MSASHQPIPRRRAPQPAAPGRILIVSNRLPVTATLEGEEIRFRRSDGGLASGLRTIHEREGSLWLGWSGLSDVVHPAAHDAYTRSLRSSSAIPIPLSSEEVAGYYRGFSNSALWPALHGWIRQPVASDDEWELYRTVNERYADTVAEHLRAGDRVWIHDYHLLLLPALLRARCPGVRIAFFLHTPFPPPALFAGLSHAPELLRGILGSDLIGFHTQTYTAYFASTVRLLLGHAVHGGDPGMQPRRSKLVTRPMGIDAAFFAEVARKSSVVAEATRIRAALPGPLFVGVDRLDYTKGIPERLLAFERLLELEPALCRRTRLLQIAVPSRHDVSGYPETRQTVESLVARINGRFGDHDWTPVDYRYCTVDTETLVSLYLAADVMLVTPLCDGMNLVAKEFVACRTDESGVLVLSSHAGAAAELHAAVLTDPHDHEDLVRAYLTAITMAPTERRARMRRLRLIVESHDVSHWSRSFLETLGCSEQSLQIPLKQQTRAGRPGYPWSESNGQHDRPVPLHLERT